MHRMTEFFRKAWSRVSMRRYQRGQQILATQERDAAERLEQLENGGRPYGPPPAGWGAG